MQTIDVFISRKSADAQYAQKLYDYLTAQGLTVFESDNTLKELGNADYIKAIDEALELSTHLMVVGSSAKNIKSPWVESEWLYFLGKKKSGRTSGNLFTVITDKMELSDVPPSLANYEVIPYNEKNFPIIYNYVRQPNNPAKAAPQTPFPAERENKALRVALVGMLVLLLATLGYYYVQPYDASIILKQDAKLQLQAAYPPFEGVKLSLLVNNEVKEAQILSNGEVIFKQLPYTTKNQKVIVKLENPYWKPAQDTLVLGQEVVLSIVPNGTLGIFRGQVRVENTAEGIANVNIQIENDTAIVTDANGSFNLTLPIKMQKKQYRLKFSKLGYATKDTYTDSTHYFPGSNDAIYTLKKLK